MASPHGNQRWPNPWRLEALNWPILNCRRAYHGNALMEYVVPAVALLLTSGLILTMADITGLMSSVYVMGTGHTLNSLSGKTLKTKGLGNDAFDNIENGGGGVSAYGSLTTSYRRGPGSFWTGAVTRTGSRTVTSDPDKLFPLS